MAEIESRIKQIIMIMKYEGKRAFIRTIDGYDVAIIDKEGFVGEKHE